jgi:hypothetical protein
MKSKMVLNLLMLVMAVPIALGSFFLVHGALADQPSALQAPKQRHIAFNSSIADWPQFRNDVLRDGSQSTDTQLSKANANALVPVTGSIYTTGGEIMASPSVYQGVLYYAVNTRVPSGTKQLPFSTMYAASVSTGQVLWSKPFPLCANMTKTDYTFSTPAVTTGMVNGVATTEIFIGWGDISRGCMYDFNGADGSLIWGSATTGPTNASPAIFPTNNGSIVIFGENANKIHAFTVNYTGTLGGRGKQLWQYDNSLDTPVPPGTAVYCQASGESCGDAVFGSPAEGLVTVNGTSHHYIYFPVGSSFTNRAGRLDAIDVDTLVSGSPKLAWAYWDPNPLPDNDFITVTVLNNSSGFATRVFTGMHTGHEYGLDAVTGQMYFDFNSASFAGNRQTFIHSTGAIVTVNGTTELIFGSGCNPSRDYKSCAGGDSGHVFAIDALSNASAGTLLWESKDYGGDIVSSPAVVNSGSNAVVYIMGPWYPKNTLSRGDLLAFDPANGTVLADYAVFNHAYGSVSSPAIYGNTIFVSEGYSIYTWPPTPGGGLAAFQCTAC